MNDKKKKVMRTILLGLVFVLGTSGELFPQKNAGKEMQALDAIRKENKGKIGKIIKTEKTKTTGELIIVKIRGLVCDFCARALEKIFRKRPEILDLKINLKEKTITLKLKKDQSLSDGVVKKLILDGGYNVISIKRSLSNHLR